MAKIERALPSTHEKARLDLERAEQARGLELRRQEARRLAAFDWLLKQENGRIVWAWLFERCGYNKPGLLRRSSDGDVSTYSTEAAAAQREVYRDVRRMVSPELLAQAEYEAEFGARPTTEKKGEKK